MAKGLKHGTGGASPLNFRVLGGTTQPANLRENDIWVNTDVTVSGWDFSGTEPTKRSKNKNLILYPYYSTTKTDNGITFTSNADGTITANGTSGTEKADSVFDIIYCWDNIRNYPLEVGKTYTFSGCPSGGGGGYYLQAVFRSKSNTVSYGTDYGGGVTFTADTTKYRIGVRIVFASGTKASNLVFKPQLEKGSTATSFVKGDATGQVWISTGSSSPAQFNSLKKNNITVYPLSAKQYVSGAWVDKTAKSYQNGAWVDWWNPFYIFKSGEGAIAPLKHYTAGGVSANHTNSSIVHKRTGSAIRAVTVTQTAVALDGYSKLCARAKCTYANSEHVPVLGLLSTAANNDQARPDIASVGVVANSATTVYSVSIPSGVSTAYIGYCGGSDIEIYDIWLE